MEKAIDIKELWINGNKDDWETAAKSYFDNQSVKNNKELETKMDGLHLHPQEIEQLDAESFYYFLYNEYFVWKYGSDQRRLARTRNLLKKHESDTAALGRIQAYIFKAFNIDPDNTAMLFCITRQIHGLGTAGASGLLAILFPEHYGTVDQYLVKALRKIDTLPEHEMLKAMKEDDLTIENAVLLEDILRRKAEELNRKFGNKDNFWTPRKVDMVLWASKRELKGQD